MLVASDYQKWSKCAAAPKMQKRFNSLAEESKNHSAPYKRLAYEKLTGSYCVSKDYEITEEIESIVKDYTDNVLASCGGDLNVQKTLTVNSVSESLRCKPDAWSYDKEKDKITIWWFSLKYEPITAFMNNKLIIEAIAVLGAIDSTKNTSLSLCVYQPQDKRKSIWDTDAKTILKFTNSIKELAEKTYLDNPETKAGDHCKRCSAKRGCPSYRETAKAAMEYSSKLDEAVELSGKDLSLELKDVREAVRLLKAYQIALEEQILRDEELGNTPEGIHITEKKGRELWKGQEAKNEMIKIAKEMGIDIKKPQDIETPAKLRKKGIDDSVIIRYSYRAKATKVINIE